MKRGFYLMAILICLFSISCKKEMPDQAILIRDCTGTYLRIKNTDYKICNIEKVAVFKTGTTVSVSFKKIPECNGKGNFPITCYMMHHFESWIEIEGIRW